MAALFSHTPDCSDLKYRIRVSARAKHVKLAFNPYKGLEIVVPKRFPRREIPRILQQHAHWISAQYERHADKLRDSALPDEIKFVLSAEQFRVEYHRLTNKHSNSRLRQTAERLDVYSADDASAIACLRDWLRQQAKRLLEPRLRQTATELGMSYAKCTVRGQKSRWGSCSSRGTISLNEQLVFMPPETVRYLMIHELCHTRHMNHSPAFWQLVASFEADFRFHEHRLDHGREAIPKWYLQSLFN